MTTLSPALAVAGVSVRQDDQSRYCLNDLHKAAGGEKRHQPSDWAETQQTKDLIVEISNSGNSRNYPIESSAGRYGGTFVCKELVYAYAMWVSPKFHLQVIRAYDSIAQQQLPGPTKTNSQLDQPLLQAIGRLTVKHAEEVETLIQKINDLSKEVAEKGHALEVLRRFQEGLLTLSTRLIHSYLPRELRGPDQLRDLDKYEPLPDAGVFRFLPQKMQVDTLPDGTPWGERVVGEISALLQSGHTKVAVSRQLGIPCTHVSAVHRAEFVRQERAESFEYQKWVASNYLSRVAGLPQTFTGAPTLSVMNRQNTELTLTLAAGLNPWEFEKMRSYLDNHNPRRVFA